MPKAAPYSLHLSNQPGQNVYPFGWGQMWDQMYPNDVPRKCKRQNLTFEQKLQVIEFYWSHKHLTLEQMVPPLRAMGFLTISATTISRCVRNEDQIREYVAGGSNRLGAKRQTLVCFPEVETALLDWLKEEANNGVRPTGDQIREKARDLCRISGVKDEDALSFSPGWLEGFRKRNGLGTSRGQDKCPTCRQKANHV